MSISKEIARHLRQVYFGGNWTTSNIKDQLEDVSWEEAKIEIQGLNSIALIVNHMTYYIPPISKVLKGEPLVAKDDESWIHPNFNNEEEWNKAKEALWIEAENFAKLIESLPDERLGVDFHDPKYGNYFRNLIGLIEHLHYHLGQIAIIKKIIQHKS